MNTIINILLITLIVVFIVDLSGIIDTLKYWIWKKFVKYGDYHNLQLKPLDCSLCMTWWINLIYIIAIGKFTIPYLAFISLCSLLSSKIADIEQYIEDLLTYIINKLYKLLK